MSIEAMKQELIEVAIKLLLKNSQLATKSNMEISEETVIQLVKGRIEEQNHYKISNNKIERISLNHYGSKNSIRNTNTNSVDLSRTGLSEIRSQKKRSKIRFYIKNKKSAQNQQSEQKPQA